MVPRGPSPVARLYLANNEAPEEEAGFLSSPFTELDHSVHAKGLDKQTHSDSNTL